MLKKLIKGALLASVLVAGLGASKLFALDYTVALTTYVPTASVTDFGLGSYPNITGNLYVRDIILTNSGATAQTVSIYDTCTSSVVAALAGKIVIESTGTKHIPIGVAQSWRLSNPGFIKSSTATDVQLTILYQ